MKAQITITDEKGKNFEGEIELKQVRSRKRKNSIVKGSKKPTPLSSIKDLYQQKFFHDGKNLSAVVKKLGSKGINFEEPNVFRALNNAKFLKKVGKRGSFKFIQKYPS